MPRGIYPRTANQLKAAVANLAKGRAPEARAKATTRLREIASDQAWRDKVSAATTEAMRRPDVRRRHLAGLPKKGDVPTFKNGNGQEPTPLIKLIEAVLSPLGFKREYPIRTKGHQTNHSAATVYKVDFGNPSTKTAIELDGLSHLSRLAKRRDLKKAEVLRSLGWTVHRIKHDAQVYS